MTTFPGKKTGFTGRLCRGVFGRPAWLTLLLFGMGLLGRAEAKSTKSTESAGGSSGPEAAGDTVEIVAQNLPAPASTSAQAVAERRVLRNFTDRYPQYEIRPFNMPQIGVESAMDSGVLMAISAGMGPNAIYVNFRQSATYIEEGFLDPLEELLARVESDNPAVRQTDGEGNWLEDPSEEEVAAAVDKLLARVPERAHPVVYRHDLSGRYEGKHVFALPTSNLVRALFYRRDLFQEAGLDPYDPPDTWEELLEAARALHRPEKRQYGMIFEPGVNISHRAYQFLVGTGARAMERGEETGAWRAAFGTRGAAEGIYFFWKLLREPFTTPEGKTLEGAAALRSDGGLLWSRGQVGMRFDYLNDEMLATVQPHLVGIAPTPMSPMGERGGELNSRMMGVFSDATPEQKLATMRYIWYLTGEEAQRTKTEIFVDQGLGQFVNPDLLERFGYERLLQRVPEGWKAAFEEAIDHGVPEPYGQDTQFIYRMMSRPINAALEKDYTGMSKEAAVDDIHGLVRDAEEQTNTQVMGILSEEEMQKRRLVAWGVLLLLVGAFGAGMRHIWKAFSQVSPPVNWRKNKRNLIWGFSMILPGVGLVAMWQYFPLLYGGLTIAFTDYKVVLDNVWVGVDNFAEVLYSRGFWESLGREFYWVSLVIGLGFWPPILLAILLQEVPTNFLKYFFRTVFYLPSVLIGIVVMFLWLQLYDPSESGTLNQLLLSLNSLGPIPATLVKLVLLGCWLSLIGLLIWLPVRLEELPAALKVILWAVALIFIGVTLSPFVGAAREGGLGESLGLLGATVGRFDLDALRWTQDPAMAMVCIVVPSVWASSGAACIIFLAGLKSVPDELYEAAAIDGAGFWHKVFYIVLPRLKFLIVLQLIMAMVQAFKGGEDVILVMTGGGPNEATTTLSLRIFYRTFMDLDYGVGTAMAWIMGGILIGFTAYQLKLLSKAEFKAAG